MKKYLLLSVLFALLVGCGAPAPAEDDVWTPPALADDVGELPEGREVVQRMVDFMQSNQELAVEARVTYESVQESGQKLQFDMLQRVAMRKPDQLFWVTLRDDATQDRAWYDKGRFRVVRQPANMWGEIRLPGGIAEAVQELVANYMITVPFPDLLSSDPQELWLGDDVTSIWYVGEAWVDGRWTDHVAIRKPGADIRSGSGRTNRSRPRWPSSIPRMRACRVTRPASVSGRARYRKTPRCSSSPFRRGRDASMSFR